MEFFNRRHLLSPLLLVLVYVTILVDTYSHHIRHHRDRFKRQQGAHLYLPGSYVSDSDEPDAGPWQEWSSPSPCSRTCGAGVSTQFRACTPGYRCQGSSRRHFSCNTQDCPDSGDYRAQQCSEFDNIPFEGVTYQWVPYTKAPNLCELNCMPRGERFYYRHKLSVTDGTKCNDEKPDVCVDGKCQPVGCDMMLGSDAREDKCRVCGGDGSTCNTVNGLLDMQDLQVGYNDILLIPAGATNIDVREIAPSNNYLAVRNTSGHYHLNGNWRIDFPRVLEFAGCKFHYNRYPQGFSAPDSITCVGPTYEPLFIVLLYQDTNVGVEYEYSVPQNIVPSTENETYAWTFDQFTPCTSSCGGGIQYRNVSCAGRRTLEPADPSLCDPSNRPADSQRCGERPCDARWVTKPWEQCSAPCGVGGSQRRQVLCEQVISNGVASIVDDEHCDNVERPKTEQPCNQGAICAEWHTGPWKPCDHICGEGKQTRVITCYRKTEGKIEKLEDAQCADPKPEFEKSCNLRPCEGVDWVTTDWTGCDKCGLNSETRRVQCATAKGEVYSNDLCDEADKPETERECKSTPAGCDFEWYASQWSQCSAKCGKGVKTRKVFCASIEDLGKVEDSKCDGSQRYNASEECEAERETCPGEWFSGPWSQCSKECGGGEKSRKVICMRDDVTVPATECGPDSIPSGSEPCNKQACDKDEVLPVDVKKPVDVTDEIDTTKESSDSGEEVSGATTEVTDASAASEATSTTPEDDDEEYEIVEDDECDDGEWVEVDEEEEETMPTASDMTEETGWSTGGSDVTEESTETSLALDDLMLSDSTLSGDESPATSEKSSDETGSGDGSTDLTSPSSDLISTEGSGDDETTVSGLPSESGMTDASDLTEATTDVSGASELTGSSLVTEDVSGGSSDVTESTDATAGSDVTDVSGGSSVDSSDVTGGSSDVTESSSDVTGGSSDVTESGGTSDVTESGGTSDVTESGGSSDVTESGGSSDVTESGGTSDVTESGGSSDVTESGATSSSDVTESSSDASSGSESTSESTSDSSTESTSDSSTESTSESSTESTVETSTDTTLDSSSEASESTSSDGSTTDSSGGTDGSSASGETSETTEAGTDQTTESGASESTDVSQSTVEGSTTSDLGTTDEVVTVEDIEGEVDLDQPTTTGKTKGSEETEATETSISTEEYTGTTESTIEDTGSTESGATGETGSTELATGSTELDTGSTELATGSTELETGSTELDTGSTESVSSESPGSTESTTEFTGSTESEAPTESTTEFTGSTESEGPTESTTEFTGSTESEGPTESTTEFTGSTEIDIWSTTEEWGKSQITDIFKPKVRKCKRRKTKTCDTSKYGCCYDKMTPAEGPFDKGCPTPKTCKETKFGCCEDGVSIALGKKFKGCPATHCEETLFGCCDSDKKTPAEGEDQEGCPPPPPKCLKSRYGCCPDNETEATGPKEKGCEPEEFSEDCANSLYGCCPDGKKSAEGEYFKGCDIIKSDCKESHFGCCPDGTSSAEGPNYRGCQTPCAESPYGCCEDGTTPAHGYNREGCCLSSPHGCCPDNVKPADGPSNEGCGCEYSPYRCCPDNVTAARGYENEGCGCKYAEHGCCPDDSTPAAGPDYRDCPCHTYQFGCCSDGVTVARGPHQQGCGCRNTEFGCCADEQTPASGPGMEGCGCGVSKHGCCLDGVTEAQGENFEGCEEVPVDQQASCSEGKERGPCRNYTVKWFFDVDYGSCSRFWYGGCEGTNNRYKSEDECKEVCIEPQGKDRCKLPKVTGPCEGYYPHWYYDKDRNHCAQFVYGGCLGNNNRFESSEECIKECVVDVGSDPCSQPREEGPCRGQYLRWYYNEESSRCEQFYYGGCRANGNNFATEMACNQQCAPPNRKKELCNLPSVEGNCTGKEPRWYHNVTENRCMPYYYTGCDGNKNNFYSVEECERSCPAEIEKDMCHLPAEIGDCANYTERWYYDTREKTCRLFYYGGCGGNGNNFGAEDACLKRCEHAPEDPAPAPPVQEPFRTDFCFLPSDSGPCRDGSDARWFYDRDGVCKQFLYGGCEGNQNNFKTSEECQQTCGQAQDVCALPQVVGPCNDAYGQYYYNYQTDTCEPFNYGGCLGNDNRFQDIASCEERCKRGPITATREPPHHVPEEPEQSSICFSPADPGNCTDNYPAFHYDTTSQRCLPFTFTGCGGNSNRFGSEEHCERECGRFRGQDVCKLQREPGPCRGYFIKSYYDTDAGRCNNFVYGGCEGNGNRFSSIEECEHICSPREEPRPEQPQPEEPRPSITNAEICRLPLDVGACRDASNSYKRYYFDDQRGECIAFIYSGCGGNQNQFGSFQACVSTCKELMTYPPSPNNEIDSEIPKEDCDQYRRECETLHCPYSFRAYVDESLCTRCACYYPCDGYDCPEGSQCSIDINRNRTTEQDETFVPVCRKVHKPGACPELPGDDDRCYEECRNDAECTLDMKCCTTGCRSTCVAPHFEVPAELVTTGYQPAYTEPPVQAGHYAPQIDMEKYEPEVSTREGDVATLNCAVRGNPNPHISWSKENLLIDGKQPRYRLLLDGTLQIITVHKTDSGIYLCTADNNLGRPLQNEIRLNVSDGVNFPARVLEVPEEESNVLVSLGSPASLQCYALGYPFPTVTWWKNDSMIPLKTSQYEQRKDFSLLIHRVELSDLGLYTCQAYNGFGKATSWTVAIQAEGPVYSNNPDDQKYLKYVVNAPEAPPPERPEEQRPQYPYRPQRPTPQPYVPHPYTEPEPEIGGHDPQPQYGVDYVVPVRTNISIPQQTFGVGSDVNIPCDVDGYPVPLVQWSKDDRPLSPSEHIEITESNRLIIKKASEADSGIYKCDAYNQYSRAESSVSIAVEGVYIHPSCTDNPFFANCTLIVHANFCTHKYYARFCCKSCTMAGQLPSHGPHDVNAINSNLI